MTAKLTTKLFISLAKDVHGITYTYARTKYVTAKSKVIITCRKHGDFLQSPTYHTNLRHGCPKCANESNGLKQQRDLTLFKKQAVAVHGVVYDYSLVSRNTDSKVPIVCRIHGTWLQSAHSHLKGHGCPTCASELRSAKQVSKNSSLFIQRAVAVHGSFYDYSLVEYISSKTPIRIICPKHGVFNQTPSSHLSDHSCPVCSHNGYSRIAIRWIESVAKRKRWKSIEHAENGGEYRIPGTRMSVDGYHRHSTTIFEFHGDRFSWQLT